MEGVAAIDGLRLWLGVAGTVAFAVTAVIAVAPRGVDLFGVVVLGVITAVGGGTLRDLIIGAPVFWTVDQTLVWVAIGASLLAFAAQPLFQRRSLFLALLYLDGLGAAVFGIQAVTKVWALDIGRPLAPIVLGVVTAVGGGILRDMLAGRPSLLMTRELYAVPVLTGCTLYVAALSLWPAHGTEAAVFAACLIFAIRAAAIRWKLVMPRILVTRTHPDA
ncbi:trimeric intracellular cation channel family protein [Limibaculum sp. M0105]|uniref:Trimeric intracellular cation channel family protein n=1 Tax=Thermohalobaculum xanthum TaxID=2753746 RepID=A0A8J7M9G6_9RHOB|nr:trimeric intracellular cation channel family protein [Thermohalobaculum xanthum]MBK0400188.1 trimeric intracellular cation channel family protein [Thermohalobaculum xanthum]